MIWEETKTQLIAGGMGVVGINYSEVRQTCRDLGIERTRALDRKIKALERSMLNAASGSDNKGGKDSPKVVGQKKG